MKITVTTDADAADWADLRQALWPHHDIAVHVADIADMLAVPQGKINLIARLPDGRAVGLAEAALRHDYVNGCKTSPVAFLEGIYVAPDHRRRGISRQLVAAIEAWARTQGCTEFASDALLANQESHQMHNALGFEETQRVVYFRKLI